MFFETATGFTIYYYAENTGFETPTFQGYSCYPLYRINVAGTIGGNITASTADISMSPLTSLVGIHIFAMS